MVFASLIVLHYLVLVGCSVSSVKAGENSILPASLEDRRQGLDIRQLKKILSTEIDAELILFDKAEVNSVLSEYNNENNQESFWNMVSDFEWDRAHNAEKESNTIGRRGLRSKQIVHQSNKFPYIVCNTDLNTATGFERKNEVQEYFDSPTSDIYNRDDMSCFFVKSLASLALVAPKSFIVHPLTSSMKVQKGSIEMLVGNMTSNITNILEYTTDQIGLEVILCPGVASTDSDGTNVVNLIIDVLKKEPSGKKKRSLSLLEDFFWISPRGTSTGHRILSGHSRSLLWSSVVAQGIESQHGCVSMLSNLLVTASSSGSGITVTAKIGDEFGSRACQLSLLAGLASSPEVCVVTAIPEVATRNVDAQWIVQSGVQNYRPLFDVGLSGRGQIVAVSDSGLDTDNCYFWDASGDIAKDGSVDLTRRKVVQYANFVDTSDRFNGHGTHIAGSIAGRKARNGVDVSNGLADGVARDAKIAFYDLENSNTKRLSVPPNQADLFETGRLAGANLHSVSWGSSSNSYGSFDYQFDQYLYEHDEFMIFVASGNGGGGCLKVEGCGSYTDFSFDISNTVLSPAVAKNVVSIGASNNEGNGQHDWYLKGNDHVAFFSARGPTADGRSKPDIIAPGFSVLSAGARPDMIGECDPSGNQELDVKTLERNPNVGLSTEFGTSMATPIATGAAALIRQYFEEGWYPSGRKNSQDEMRPSGALIKAVILNGGREMNRIQNFLKYTSTKEYDQAQNYGMISLVDSLSIAGKNNFKTRVIDGRKIHNGITHTYTFQIDTHSCDSDIEFSATLVWVEPASVPGCNACTLNDLDLRVNRGWQTFYPNGLKKKDSINNTERVRMSTKHQNTLVVSIVGHNIVTSLQKYVLVVTGCLKQ